MIVSKLSKRICTVAIALCVFVTPAAALSYQEGMQALERGDFETAIANFEFSASNLQDDVSMYQLGQMYRNGTGVEVDLVRAIEWYDRAIGWQNDEAREARMDIYQEGGMAFIQGDREASFRIMHAFAMSGDAAVQVVVGGMYERGEGVEQNLDEALRWYNAAAEQDYPGAQESLDRLRPE